MMNNKIRFIVLLLFFSLSFALEAVDSEIDSLHLVSPRVTGLGMSGAALGKSCEAIFLNPAMLASNDKINTYVSTYRLLDDIIYLNGAFTYPFYNAAVGIGYKSKRTGGIDVSDYSDLSGGRPNEDRIETATYAQDAYYLGFAYSFIPKTVTSNDFLKSLNLGLGIKSYSIKMTGSSRLEDTSASGYDLDLGLYTDVTDSWAVGLTYRNFLDSGSGSGSLYWQNGTVEPISTILTFGNKFSYADGGFILLFDADFFNNKPYKTLLHSGFEVRSYKYVIFRAGVDQYPYPSGSSYKVFNAVSGGLTFTPLKDFNIDYAYYPGDGYALNALHYAGISFDSFDVFTSQAGGEQNKDTYMFKVESPHDYLVTEVDSISINVMLKGDQSFTINDKSYQLVSGNYFLTKVFPLQEGINEFSFKNKDREINRKVFKILSYKSLVKEKKEKDIRRLIYTSFFTEQALDKKITLADLADYIVASTGVRLPERMPAVFNNVDIIYLKGYLGVSGAEINDQAEITKGDLAVILARLEGYDYIFENVPEEQWPLQAVEVLSSTGYFNNSDFSPVENPVTAKEAILLLARTGVINRQILDYYGDFPVCYLDRELQENNQETVYLRMCNAEKYEKAEINISGKVKEYQIKAQGNYNLPITYTLVPGTEVSITLTDKYKNSYIFNYAGDKGSRQVKSAVNAEEALYLVRITPKELYPGIKCSIELAVPTEIEFKEAILQSELLDNELIMEKNGDLWVAKITIPAEANPKSYILNFKMKNKNGKVYTKNHSLVVLGLKKQSTDLLAGTISASSLLKDSDILIKTNKRSVKQGESIEVYVGVLQNYEAVNEIKVIFVDNNAITAQKVEKMMWKVTKQITKAITTGKQYFKVFIKDSKGGVLEKKYFFNVDTSVIKTVVKSETKASTAVQSGGMKIFSKLVKDTTGRTLIVRAKASADILKATTVIGSQNLTMVKDKSGLWTAKYQVPKVQYNKSVTVKVYLKDKAGKVIQQNKTENL